MAIDVTFLDSGREPQCKPDPRFPDGRHIRLMPEKPEADHKSCTYNLPYPAPRCGSYVVECKTCGYRAALNVAGRPDDPRIVTLPCKSKGLDS